MIAPLDLTPALTESQKRRQRERNAKIRKRNAILEGADPALKRVLIAQDVLSQLKAKLIVAKSGVYVAGDVSNIVWQNPDNYYSVSFEEREKLEEETRNRDLRGLINERETAGEVLSCTACALGSLFVSAVRACNNYTIGDARNGNMNAMDIKQYLAERLDMFTVYQLSLIETAFECETYGNFGTAKQWSEATAAIAFGSKYPKYKRVYNKFEGRHKNVRSERNDDLRLKAIMKNIIANNGTFIP
jgi:hypothetical protein